MVHKSGSGHYYLPNEKLDSDNNTIAKLYDKWKNTDIFIETMGILEEARITARIETLITVENSKDKQKLIEEATNRNSRTEVVYAAWAKLGQLKKQQWSIQEEEWETEQSIYAGLEDAFEAKKHQDPDRGGILLGKLKSIHLEREIRFRKADLLKIVENIKSYIDNLSDNQQEISDKLETVRNEIEATFVVPAAEEFTANSDAAEHQHRAFLERLKIIKGLLKPECFKFLDFSGEQIVFVSEKLRYFQPIIIKSNNEPPQSLKAKSWDELRNRDNERYVGIFKDTFVNAKSDSGQTIAWPKYIRSIEDPNVILKFIPSDGSGLIQPFYIALHEVTNEQYRNFLNRIKTKNYSSYEIKHNGVTLVKPEDKKHPCKGIFLNESLKNSEFPASYITYNGAKLYANRFLKASLPSPSQYVAACAFDSGTPNVRGQSWQDYVVKYNPHRNEISSPFFKPLGAVVDIDKDKNNRPIDPNGIVDVNSSSLWPRPVSEADKNKLTDLVGNVWEWCRTDVGGTDVLCGGSCLSRPEHTGPKAAIEYSESTAVSMCDVGFRVVVSLPLTQQDQ